MSRLERYLLAALKNVIGPDSLLGQKAGGECYCNEPDESIGESGTIECEECGARREVKAIQAIIAKAEGRNA